jgi:hypothetical protein
MKRHNAGGVFLLACLLTVIAQATAQAGRYRSTTSTSGAVTVIGAPRIFTLIPGTYPYSYNPAAGILSAERSASSGSDFVDINGNVIESFPASVECKGSITMTYRWHNEGNRYDVPPVAVIVQEYARAWVGGYNQLSADNPVGMTFAADNGLNHPMVPNPPDFSWATGPAAASQGTRYSLIRNPPASISITNSPRALAQVNDASVHYRTNATAQARIEYSTAVYPIHLVVTGGIVKNGQRSVLIGQRLQASLFCPVGSLSDIEWYIGGRRVQAPQNTWDSFQWPYKSYTRTRELGEVKTILDGDLPGQALTCYFARPYSGRIRVYCKAKLYLPGSSTPELITADTFVQVKAPKFTSRATIDEVKEWSLGGFSGSVLCLGDPPLEAAPNATLLHTYTGPITGPADGNGNTGADRTPGFQVNGYAHTPPDFVEVVGGTRNAGHFSYTQIIKTGRRYIDSSGNSHRVWAGADPNLWYLDGSVDYMSKAENSQTAAPWSADPAIRGNRFRYLTDSPQQPREGTRVIVEDDFRTHLMYKPPGAFSIWVSLDKYSWKWSGTYTDSGAGDGSMTVIHPSRTFNGKTSFQRQPEWKGPPIE